MSGVTVVFPAKTFIMSENKQSRICLWDKGCATET